MALYGINVPPFQDPGIPTDLCTPKTPELWHRTGMWHRRVRPSPMHRTGPQLIGQLFWGVLEMDVGQNGRPRGPQMLV